MGIYIKFESYDPDDEGDDDVPEFLRDPDPGTDLDAWLYERTEDLGPHISAQGRCTACGVEGLAIAPVWRWSARRRKRYPVFTVDGANCLGCGAKGAMRERLDPDEPAR